VIARTHPYIRDSLRAGNGIGVNAILQSFRNDGAFRDRATTGAADTEGTVRGFIMCSGEGASPERIASLEQQFQSTVRDNVDWTLHIAQYGRTSGRRKLFRAVRDQLISSVRANLGVPATGALPAAVRDELMRLYTSVSYRDGQALQQKVSGEVDVTNGDDVQAYVREISQREGGLKILAAIFKHQYIKSVGRQH